MRLVLSCLVVGFSAILIAVPATSGTETSSPFSINAIVRSRTSLQVSSSDLRFDVSEATLAPTVVVAFTAAARAAAAADVVLSVEALRAVETGGVAASPDLAVSFQADDGHTGTVAVGVPRVVGTWKGSGVRGGQVRFTLHGATAMGRYRLPVMFALSAP